MKVRKSITLSPQVVALADELMVKRAFSKENEFSEFLASLIREAHDREMNKKLQSN